MATLESSSRITLDQYQPRKLLVTGSMQRARGMGRLLQGEPSSSELDSQTQAVVSSELTTQQQQNHPPRPTRNNSKLKVLVRSHAMREETSPPRVPTPTNTIAAPCITLNTSAAEVASATQVTEPLPSDHCQQTTTAIFYNQSTASSPSKPLSPTTQKPCLIVSPTTDDGSPKTLSPLSSPSIDNNSSFRNNNNNQRQQQTVTVRTQDVLNASITRKFIGDYQEINKNSDIYLNKCEIVDKCAVTKTSNTNNSSDYMTNNNNSSLKQTSAINSQRSVDNTHYASSKNDQLQQYQQQQPQQPNLYSNNCECIIQNCMKCSKNNELNINNNSNNINNNNVSSTYTASSQNTLTVNRVNPRHKLRHQSSSQGSFEGSSSTSPCLSRDSSTEFYTDTHGTDLTQFLIETLNKNAKDRVLMLKIELDLVNLAKDSSQKQFKFPAMSSYQRMLVHRCAAYFGMDHNIEPSGKAVVVSKTRNTRIPEMRFKDHIREDLLFPEEPRRSILKRDSNSFEDCNYKSPDRQFDNRRSKSFEEREEEYERARRRIFKDGTMQDCSQEEFNWAEMPWPESECTKIRLLNPEQNVKQQNRLLKVQSVEGRSETLRPCVAKSYSFGGYGGVVSVLTRGDSITSTHSAGPRLLTKQDSSTSTISWRLSPSSSGYKTQSQRSDSVTPSPTATPHQLSDASGKNSLEGIDPIEHSITEVTIDHAQQTETPTTEANQIVWAVTDMQSVPKGSVLIDPQSGQPFTNNDGSIYHFDPSNPPPGFTTSKPPPSPPKIATPQRSPIKERTPSPKKQSKSKVSPLKNKSLLINSSTSPSLPMTPPLTNQFSNTNMTYAVTRTPVDNSTNAPLSAYPIYPNGFVSAGVPTPEGNVPVYQPPIGMVYAPYAIPPPFENRQQDGSVPELSGYFVNMAVSDAQCSQSMYQPQSGGYWSQQPVTYYQTQPPPLPPVNQHHQQPQQQRYPVQMPVSQTPPSYYPPNYPPNAVPIPPNTELVPVYTNQVQMVYSPQPTNPSNPVYIQNPNPVVYAQNTMFPASQPAPPPPQPAPIYGTNMVAQVPPNAAYTPPNQCYNQNVPILNTSSPSVGYEQKKESHRNTPRSNNKQHCYIQKVQNQTYCHQQPPQSSNHSSGGSNSPANTVITGYLAPNLNTPINYRQCTPPETPPTHHVGFAYPPPSHPVLFRQMGGYRGSPPVNVRSSRSPTPAPEYPTIGQIDRGQRYTVPSNMCHGMPAVIPGDVRLISGRAQPPVYRQTYRQQTLPPNHHENTSGRSHKMRKPRTKVPALPPSGRQSNQSIQVNNQHRY